MDVRVASTPDEVAIIAAETVLATLASLPAGRALVLGLATGSSPLGLYRELGRAVAAGTANFAAAQGFALDEYVALSPDHPQSYRSTLQREVCDVLGLPRAHLHVPDGSGQGVDALQQSAHAYDESIAAAGGVDLQILGIGANGHLGFNEPGSSLTSRTRVKRLSQRTRTDNARFFASPDDVPTHCVTQGLGTILDARRLLLVATGPAKAPAVAAALEGPLTASCPGSVIQLHPDAIVVLDEAAASLLTHRDYYEDAAAGL